MGNATEEAEEIVKARTDKREYRKIVLGNSLKVLLISDPETDQSAACLSVGIGCLSGPDSLEGLAGLLGWVLQSPSTSEKYPSEANFENYVIEHGGCFYFGLFEERTNYCLGINNDCFEEALYRFSQLFIKPLMPAEAIMRKIETIESTYQNNLLSDPSRRMQLRKHISKESHRHHRFSGNWYTLDVRPKAKGMDIRHELLKFHEENYSANLMNLALYTRESLDKVQSLVENMFQDIRNSNQRGFQSTGSPFTSEHLMILVKAIPIKEGHTLSFEWPESPSWNHSMETPSYYLRHVIGHEGEGSVNHILKTRGWARSLNVIEDLWRTPAISSFCITIDLTDAGHEHMREIVGLIFKYIQFLKEAGVCKRVFDELSAVCETIFHYQDKINPVNYVENIASNMQRYPPKDWLVGSSLLSNFNPDLVKRFLEDQLSPEKVRIFWESKKFEGQTDKVEPWYRTAYSIEKVTTSMIQKWMSLAPTDDLQLPAPNMFIPTDFSLKDAQMKLKFPVLLRKSSYSKLWYKSDTTFSIPKAYLQIEFNCPHARNSPQAEVLTDIFIRLLRDSLNQYDSPAQVAGFHYYISITDRGFEVTMFGYNDKLNILLEKVIHKIANFEVKPERFSIIKEIVKRDIGNFKFEEPHKLAFEYSSLILKGGWPWKEKLEVLPHLEAEELVKFTPVMFSSTFLECFIAGNMESDEATSIVQNVEDIFFKGSNPMCQPQFPALHRTNVVKLGRGVSYLYSEQGLNPSNVNSALLHYVQVHRDDFMLNVKLHLFGQIANTAFFHQLSIIEQPGYKFALIPRNDYGIHGACFLIQSTVKSPRDLDLRVEAFLEMLENKIYKMTNDEFKRNVNALIETILVKHKNLWEESKFYWQEIFSGTLKFDRREAEVAILRHLTQEEFIDFFSEYIKVGSPRKKTLSVRVYGKKHLYEYKSEKNEPLQLHSRLIDDILSFRRSQSHYGSFKGSFSNMSYK